MESVVGVVATISIVAFGVGVVGLFRPVKWARIATRKRAGLLMAASLVVFSVSGALLPSDTTEPEALASSTTLPPTTNAPETTSTAPASSSSTVVTTTSIATTTTLQVPSYSIVSEEDISFAGAVRYSLRVTVEAGTRRAGLALVAEDIVNAYRASRPYNALNILFYHYEILADDATSLGSWDDSPYGDWSRASEVQLGDYATHASTDNTKEKDWSLLPSQREAVLYRAYLDALYAIDTIDDDVLIAAAAEAAGAVPEEVEAAIDAFLTWVFNDES